MPRYRVYDMVLDSVIALPELVGADAAPTCTFLVVQQPFWPAPVAWYQTWHSPDGAIWLQCGRVADGYVLRFADLATFWVQADGRRVAGFALPATPLDTLRHLLLNQVLPLLLNGQGRLTLHASAVALPAGAVAFLGMSGWGKSTLATYCARQGMPLLSDDCVLLREHNEHWECVPGYGSVRLWHDSIAHLGGSRQAVESAHYTTKQRWDLAERSSAEAGPLRRLFFLTPPAAANTTIEIEPLAPRDAYLELMTYMFTLDPHDQSRMVAHCTQLARLANTNLCYRLRYPHEYSRLPALFSAIAAHTAQPVTLERTRYR